MVHFSCSHASWREGIVPDLSHSAYKSTRVSDGIPILEAAPSSHVILLEMSAQGIEFAILRSGITTVYIDRIEYTEIEALYTND